LSESAGKIDEKMSEDGGSRIPKPYLGFPAKKELLPFPRIMKTEGALNEN
jgi:hypothetical protein